MAWMAGKFTYKRCRKLASWTLAQTASEAARRCDPGPIEATTPVLPLREWKDAELAAATNCTWVQS
ncbi:MAG: hypothetical protein MK364_24400, partial [Pirellulales bacterium]|nr:hypothetical protein [Pirellulales bacterium]